MIAKLVVWGEDRSAALKKLRYCLRQYNVRYTPMMLCTSINWNKILASIPSSFNLIAVSCYSVYCISVLRSSDSTLTSTSCSAFRVTQSLRPEMWAPASFLSTTLISSPPHELLLGQQSVRRRWGWCCRRGSTRRSSHRAPLVRGPFLRAAFKQIFQPSDVILCVFNVLDPFSPFGSSSGWRNNMHLNRNMTLQLGGKSKYQPAHEVPLPESKSSSVLQIFAF